MDGLQVRRRMPIGFGPSPSPRQRADGRPWTDPVAEITAHAISFLTDRDKLGALVPPGAHLAGEPVVTVEMMSITSLQWLAGRGYSTLGVRFPISVTHGDTKTTGPFLSILWENKADPILTGREELGYAKLYCDIPAPRRLIGSTFIEAGWEGHRFMEMAVADLAPAQPAAAAYDGVLHYYSMPVIGSPGENLTEGFALTPPSPHTEILDHQTGEGTVKFLHSSWEQLPTLFHIVNVLAALPIIEPRGATRTMLRSDTSLHNHIRLGATPHVR